MFLWGYLKFPGYYLFSHGDCGSSTLTKGLLCKKESPCPDDFYSNGNSCLQCPAGSTSSSPYNKAVWACKCPDGKAMTFNVWQDFKHVAPACIDAASCSEGVLDASTNTCWKFVGATPTWSDAQDACQRLGMELLQLPAAADPPAKALAAVVPTLYHAFGNRGGDHVWAQYSGQGGCPGITLQEGALIAIQLGCGEAVLGLRGAICSKAVNESFGNELDLAVLQEVSVPCPGCWFAVMPDPEERQTLTGAGACSYYCMKMDFSNLPFVRLAGAMFANSSQLAPHLRELTISNHKVTDIQGVAFEGVPNLYGLYMSNGTLESIDPTAFSGLVNLRVLDVRWNRLSFWRLGVFDPLSRLNTILMAGNPHECQPHFPASLQLLDVNFAALFTIAGCLPEGCNAPMRWRVPSSGGNPFNTFAVLQGFKSVMSVVRKDVVRALDLILVNQTFYVVESERRRCWCVEEQECFDFLV
mmetsp:Transcript_30984/g.64307  ORF Transcript_30984/g.64307 Transcript_30984/m.64307 type:complete len:470 (-) Transcript_30984:214-1623(-)